MPDARIETLIGTIWNGVDLGLVPGWSAEEETGSRDSGWRKRWFDWRDAVHDYRSHLHRLCDGDRLMQSVERDLCAADHNRFITLWGYIHEPRPRQGETKIKPFTQMAFQIALADDAVATINLEDQRDTFVSKTRGLGMTWLYSALTVWGWNWHEWVALWVSRKEDLVDKPGDLNSIFGKVLFIIDRLPPFLLPEGWDRANMRHKNLITHPNGVSIIQGDSTTGFAGVGGRATFAGVDEAAKIQDLRLMRGSLDGTTDHVLLGSTEDESVSREWWDMWHEAKKADPTAVHELDYFLNPYFDDDWYARTRKRFEGVGDLPGFEREYLRQPINKEKMVYGLIYDVPWTDAGYDDTLPLLLGGIDPGRADDTAIVWAQPVGGDHGSTMRWIKCYEKNYMPAEFYAHILTGLEPEPGDLCYQYWTAGPTQRDRFTDNDRDIMAWTRTLPWSPDKVRYFMDPSGGNKDTSGLSFHIRLIQESKRLRTREAARIAKAEGRDAPTPQAIVPLYKEIFKHNDHDKRRLAMRTVLLRSEVSHTERMRRWRDAFEHYRFREQTANATSQPTPTHDEFSHLVTASEYLAIYAGLGMDRPKAVREQEIDHLAT